MGRALLLISKACLIILLYLVATTTNASAKIIWGTPTNISNSEGYVSSQPFLLNDPAEFVHLFWAERVTGEPNDRVGWTDTVMYSRWDGASWSEPLDIHISPRGFTDKNISALQAVLDDHGTIHLVWLGPEATLYYSFAASSMANSAANWSPPLLLAHDSSSTKFSVAIAYEAPDVLHMIYARGEAPGTPEVNRSLAYIRSEDRGLTWSEPRDIAIVLDFDRGVSDTRLIAVAPNRLYTTWTEWDTSGNGQSVYFMRSLDSGLTWEQPVRLAFRVGDEYERDWANLEVLGEDQLMVMWEGGFRAYRQAQYSSDGGATWSDPIDTFPWLIGENGYAEFAQDSTGRVHVFVAQRIREGNADLSLIYPEMGLWHSVWQGGTTWQEPTISGGMNPMVNSRAVIARGNQVVAAWHSGTHFDVMVLTGEITDAPPIAAISWPEPTPSPTPGPPATATPSASSTPATATPTAALLLGDSEQPPSPSSLVEEQGPRFAMFLSLLSSVTVLTVVILFNQRRHKHKF
ncbi:MAG: exo-alpha-sialidase [Caldilineaceae bacterium]|nr:exo-alpha-sialidase [Caldilineaceae bacterium]